MPKQASPLPIAIAFAAAIGVFASPVIAAARVQNDAGHRWRMEDTSANRMPFPSAAQGGNTGGSVYPGINSDHHQHGYNGG